MPIKKYKPITPSHRGLSLIDRKDLSNDKPIKSLTKGLNKKGGRNHQGRITSFKKSGGHKNKYRIIDFKRRDLNGYVEKIEYDPNRSAFIACVRCDNGNLRYILAPNKLAIGQRVESGPRASINIGNSLPLMNIPVGTLIHNIELKPGQGGQLLRAAGCYGQLIQKFEETNMARIKLVSGEHRLIPGDCIATIGILSNIDNSNQKLGKAGRKRWLGVKPTVRGVAMNPVDHPHGGGEGKTSGGRHPVTPWGKLTKGTKTRNVKKFNPLIIQKRK
jgi:large subunit ribosomal protein L2